MERFIGILGIFAILGIAYLMSNNKNKIDLKIVVWGLGLQLLFGVIGKRWLERQDFQQIIKDNDCKFIRPSGEELCPNYKNAGAAGGDGGCYW